MDSLYLYQSALAPAGYLMRPEFASPCSYDLWKQIRSLVDYGARALLRHTYEAVVEVHDQPDMSIWSVTIALKPG